MALARTMTYHAACVLSRIFWPDMTPEGPWRLLLIDDEPLIAVLVARMLGPAYAVTRAASGEVALEWLARGDAYDLLLCDLMMPGLTGMDVHARLQAEGSPHVDKMVFLTGGAFVGDAGQFLARVSNPCLEKPFLAEELRAVVREALRS